MQPAHFLSVDDFSDDVYEKLFRDAASIKRKWRDSSDSIFSSGAGRMVSLLFAENSTRTSMSFEKAAQKIGCYAVPLPMNTSSIAKGESYQDTACMAAMGADILVARHGGAAGTLRNMADTVLARHPLLKDVAVINAGEGTGEHPTQALLDLFTIDEHFGRKNVHIGFYGDLSCGRTAHSLIKLASRFGATFSCIAPSQELQMPSQYLDAAARHVARPYCTDDINEVIGTLDVLYVTRLQTERRPKIKKWFEPKRWLPDQLHHRFDQNISGYGVTGEMLASLPETAIVMHPLPRLDEMPAKLDSDPRLVHIEQAYNGIMTRAALLRHCLGAG